MESEALIDKKQEMPRKLVDFCGLNQKTKLPHLLLLSRIQAMQNSSWFQYKKWHARQGLNYGTHKVSLACTVISSKLLNVSMP